MWDYRAKLIRVKDGDTAVMLLDKGHRETLEIDARLQGVFAPDATDAGYKETTQYAIDWFAQFALPNVTWPFIVTCSRLRNNTAELLTLGRYVCVITDITGSHNLNLDVQSFVNANGYPGGIGAPKVS